MAAESELPELISSIKSLVEVVGKQNEDEGKDKQKNSNKALVKGLAKNTGTMLGLTTGMLSIKNIFGQAAKDNKEVIKQLSLFSTASTSNSKKLLDNLDTGYTTLKEELGTQSDIFAAGLGVLSKGNTESFTAMKALGVNVAEAANFTQFNTQALGMSMDGAVDLSESLIESSRANMQVTNNLIKAIDSMQQALKKTSVELGPEMSKNMQSVVARMAQDNTAMSGDIANFVSSFLAGEQGFMKAAKLGVMFTGNETEQQLVEKIEQLSERIVQMGAGAQGAGGGVAFQRFEDAFGLSRENFMVAQKFGRNIEGLRKDNNKAAAESLKSLDAARTMEVATRDFQAKAVEFQQGVANALDPLSWLLPSILAAIVLSNTALATIAFQTNPAVAAFGSAAKNMMGKVMGSGVMKAGIMTAGIGMMGKDLTDAYTGKDGGMNGKNVGGVAGGAIGAAIGSVLLPGIGTWAGMALGNLVGGGIGSMFDPDESDAIKTTADNSSHQAKDTEEIRRIQENQERRLRSLANPQMSILTTINDTLVRNLAVLERSAGQQRRQTELMDDAKFDNNSGGTAPGLLTSRPFGA